MNEYPVTFKNPDGTTNAALLVTDAALVTLPTTEFWTLTPSGNGNSYSGTPSGNLPTLPTWTAGVPGYTKTGAFSVNLTSLVNPNTATLSIASGYSVAGWSITGGNTLAYNGTSVAQGNLQLVATTSGGSATSNVFAVNGLGAVVTDTTPPTVPYALQAVAGTTGAALSWYPANDPNASNGWTGMASYLVQRSSNGGTSYSSVGLPNSGIVTAASKGLQLALTQFNLGTQSPVGTVSITNGGSSLQIDAYGTGTTTADVLTGVFVPVTGNFTAFLKLTSFTNASTAYGKAGIDIRTVIPTDSVNGPGSPHIFCTLKPPAGGVGAGMDYRASAGAAFSYTADVASSFTPGWNVVTRVGNTVTSYYASSLDATGLASAQVATVTQTLPSTVYLCVSVDGGTAGGESIVQIDQFGVTQDAAISYNDTTATGAGPYLYQVEAIDVQGNDSAWTPAATWTPAASGGKPFLTDLQNMTSGTQLSAQHSDYYAPGGQNARLDIFTGGNINLNSQTVPTVLSTGKAVGVLGLCVQGPPSSGVLTSTEQTDTGAGNVVALAVRWKKAGGQVHISAYFGNPALGSNGGEGDASNPNYGTTDPFPNLLTNGDPIRTFWQQNQATLAALLLQIQSQVGDFVYRPFLEHSGNWFWWGYNKGGGGTYCTPSQFAALWIDHYNYMIGQGLTQMIWDWNVNGDAGNTVTGAAAAAYPGSAYVDVVSLDDYENGGGTLACVSNGTYGALTTFGKQIVISENGPTGASNNSSYNIATKLSEMQSQAPLVRYMCSWPEGCQLDATLGAATYMANTTDLAHMPAGN